MNDKKLSVCLLVYNHAHIIEQVIDSILCQTFSNFEFIISDDQSTDNSFEIIFNCSQKDNRIKAIKTEKNLGMAGNANFAISNTNSEWVALLHHDDILSKDCFESWLKISEVNENIAFVFNDYIETNSNYKKNRIIRFSFTTVIKGKKFLNDYLLNYWGSPARGTALIRKKYFNEIGGMNEKFGMLADVDLWMRLSAKWDVGYVDEPLIEVFENRPKNYPKEYTEFTWDRIFILFDIHSNNINKQNFPNYFQYMYKRFVFRNKVSVEIIKWHLYALIKRKNFIIKDFQYNKNNYELYYSRLVRKILNFF